MTNKWLKVVSAEMESGGNSAFKPSMPLGNSWRLKLEDGSEVYRPVRYKKSLSKKRGWYHRRSSDDALPPPKKVKVTL